MKELVKTIAESLVDDPSQVQVSEQLEDGLVVINLTVKKEDMGRIIGKEGRTAKALRTIINAIATKDGKKVTIKIVE